jgi:magnesium transporter
MNDETDPSELPEKKAEDLSVHMSDQEIETIVEAVQAQDSDTVHAFLDDLAAVDVAEIVSKINDEDRNELINMYAESIDPLVFAEMAPELRRKTLSEMSAADVAGIISALESDDALLLIENLDDDFQKEIIEKLSVKMRLMVEEGLSFPEDSAGRLMQRKFVAVPQFWTVGKTIDYIRQAADSLPEDFFDIFVITPTYHVLGHIALNRLIRAKRSIRLEDLANEESEPIPALMDQEQVAHQFRRDNVTSAPVIDESGRLIGVITIDDIVDVIDEEAQEDIMKMAGVDQTDLYSAVLSTTSNRFRWLFINLLTAFLASFIISFFGATIEQIVALAVLMPIVASMGGNAGTQALTVATRALATRQISKTNTWRVIWKETLVGTLNGAAFAVITGLIAGIWFASPMLGIVIGMAMIINLFVAGFFGAGIPILLDRYGSDPAVSSAVFVTTVTDIVGFFAFLGLAAVLLF